MMGKRNFRGGGASLYFYCSNKMSEVTSLNEKRFCLSVFSLRLAGSVVTGLWWDTMATIIVIRVERLPSSGQEIEGPEMCLGTPCTVSQNTVKAIVPQTRPISSN